MMLVGGETDLIEPSACSVNIELLIIVVYWENIDHLFLKNSAWDKTSQKRLHLKSKGELKHKLDWKIVEWIK